MSYREASVVRTSLEGADHEYQCYGQRSDCSPPGLTAAQCRVIGALCVWSTTHLPPWLPSSGEPPGLPSFGRPGPRSPDLSPPPGSEHCSFTGSSAKARPNSDASCIRARNPYQRSCPGARRTSSCGPGRLTSPFASRTSPLVFRRLTGTRTAEIETPELAAIQQKAGSDRTPEAVPDGQGSVPNGHPVARPSAR